MLNAKVCLQTFGKLYLADGCQPVKDIIYGVGSASRAGDAKEKAAKEAYDELCKIHKIVCELLMAPAFMWC